MELHHLPVEIIFIICNNLCITDIYSLSKTGKILRNIISSPSFWKNRILRRSGVKCRFVPGKNVDVPSFYSSREHILNFFEPEAHDSVQLAYVHSSSFCIDAIHLIGDSGLFAIGDRGGAFSICSLSDVLENKTQKSIFSNGHTHKGWIWSICSDANVIATGCWDSNLHIWTLDEATVNLSTSFKLSSAILCSTFIGHNLVSAGLFDKSLVVNDYRAPPTQTALSNSYHRGPVLCLASLYSLPNTPPPELDPFPSSENGEDAFDILDSSSISLNRLDSSLLPINASNISASNALTEVSPSGDKESSSDLFMSQSSGIFFTGSKDRLLAAWDIRSFNRPIAEKKFEDYPRAISLLDADELWVAEQPKRLHVLTNTRKRPISAAGGSSDCRTYFSDVCTQEMHENWMRFGTIQADRSAVFLIGTSGSVEVLHPTLPPLAMRREPLFTDIRSLPISLSYADETLLVGTGNGTIRLWMSKRRSDAFLSSRVISS